MSNFVENNPILGFQDKITYNAPRLNGSIKTFCIDKEWTIPYSVWEEDYDTHVSGPRCVTTQGVKT